MNDDGGGGDDDGGNDDDDDDDVCMTYLSINSCISQQSVLDAMQETVLKEELNKLTREHRLTVEFDTLLLELSNALQADKQYIAERVYLEKAVLVQTYGSKEAILSNKQLLELKNKQKQLNALTIDSLKAGLQQKYDEVFTTVLYDDGCSNDDEEEEEEELYCL